MSKLCGNCNVTTFGLSIAFVIFLLDQFSKWAMLELLHLKSQSYEITSFFNLVLVWNTGVSFGMFAGNGTVKALILVIVAAVIVVVLLQWLRRSSGRLMPFGIGLVIGGAIGNIIDRLRFGAVVDFLDFHLGDWHWPAFNVADSAICVGVVLLCWQSMTSGNSKIKDSTHHE